MCDDFYSARKAGRSGRFCDVMIMSGGRGLTQRGHGWKNVWNVGNFKLNTVVSRSASSSDPCYLTFVSSYTGHFSHEQVRAKPTPRKNWSGIVKRQRIAFNPWLAWCQSHFRC